MNIASCALKLLTYFSPEERGVPDSVTYPGRNAAVLEAMNSGLQDLFGKGKPWVRNDDRGVVLIPPATVTIAVTTGSTAATITGWADWMSGCTIIIDGAEVDNQIRNNSASAVLKYPYSGLTGTHTAKVYHDSIDLGTDVLEVIDPVRLNRVPMSLMSAEFIQPAPRNIEDYGFHHTASRITFQSAATTAGTPYGYLIDTWSPDEDSPPRIRMRIFPAPLQAGFIDYSVMLAPPRITSIADTSSLPIPFGFVESIFLPIATEKLRVCPFWRATINDQQVQTGYANALALLAESVPGKTTGFRFTTSF